MVQVILSLRALKKVSVLQEPFLERQELGKLFLLPILAGVP